LRGYLHTDRCAPCDSKLFDEFCDHLKDEGIEREEEIIALKLYHPVSPGSWLALRHWERKLEGFNPDTVKQSKQNYFRSILLRTMWLLSLEGAVAEVQWLENLIRDQFPGNWHNRHIVISKFERDSKTQHLQRQQPTDALQSSESDRGGSWKTERDFRLDMLAARARNKK
jgi:hypothetical protein